MTRENSIDLRDSFKKPLIFFPEIACSGVVCPNLTPLSIFIVSIVRNPPGAKRLKLFYEA